MREPTIKDIEKDILYVIGSFQKGFNDTEADPEKAENAVQGIIQIIGATIQTIAEKDQNYPHEKKLKKFVNMLYANLKGYEDVRA